MPPAIAERVSSSPGRSAVVALRSCAQRRPASATGSDTLTLREATYQDQIQGETGRWKH